MASDVKELITHYRTVWESKYGEPPKFNAINARWDFETVLEDFSPTDAKNMLDYYMKVPSNSKHSLIYFFRNYQKLYENMEASNRDAQQRAIATQESIERARAWRERKKKLGDKSS